jgi:REP element-mobilizing transposase RayT
MRYRHYKNLGAGEDLVYITTTCLDFAHVLRRGETRDRLVRSLLSDHRYYGAQLHAFVVMVNHMHLVSRLPAGRTSSWFMQRIKKNSASQLLPTLTPDELRNWPRNRDWTVASSGNAPLIVSCSGSPIHSDKRSNTPTLTLCGRELRARPKTTGGRAPGFTPPISGLRAPVWNWTFSSTPLRSVTVSLQTTRLEAASWE